MSTDAVGLAEKMRLLAREAETLAAAIGEARAEFSAAGEPVSLTGFRLDDASGLARGIGRELQATAADLDRLAARPAGACQAAWGCCPDHGGTLASSGGKTWCQLPGCGRKWDYDRLGLPCEESQAWLVTDKAGGTLRLCQGHGRAAHQKLAGAVLTPLTGKETTDA